MECMRGLVAREIELFVSGRNCFRNRTRVLLFCKTGEVRRRAFMPAQRIAGIWSAPAEQPHPPRDRAMHERLLLLIPNRVGGDAQRGRSGIDESIGRLDDDFFSDGAAMFFGGSKNFRQIIRHNRTGFVTGNDCKAK